MDERELRAKAEHYKRVACSRLAPSLFLLAEFPHRDCSATALLHPESSRHSGNNPVAMKNIAFPIVIGVC
jgi:hypothetical protein